MHASTIITGGEARGAGRGEGRTWVVAGADDEDAYNAQKARTSTVPPSLRESRRAPLLTSAVGDRHGVHKWRPAVLSRPPRRLLLLPNRQRWRLAAARVAWREVWWPASRRVCMCMQSFGVVYVVRGARAASSADAARGGTRYEADTTTCHRCQMVARVHGTPRHSLQPASIIVVRPLRCS